jgi:hypothetical protein
VVSGTVVFTLASRHVREFALSERCRSDWSRVAGRSTAVISISNYQNNVSFGFLPSRAWVR